MGEGILEEVDETQETMNKPKKMEKYNELEVINTNKPIWIRDKESVTEEAYGTFYKGISVKCAIFFFRNRFLISNPDRFISINNFQLIVFFHFFGLFIVSCVSSTSSRIPSL